MGEFEPLKMHSYSIAQIADFISCGKITKEELYANGYPAPKRPELEAELARRAQLPIDDEEMWQWAQRQNTIKAYQKYLRQYDVHEEGAYRGKYVFDAKDALEDLIVRMKQLKEDLFNSMRTSPWLFDALKIQYLIDGVDDPNQLSRLRQQRDIVSRFISTGQTISFDEIKGEKIIPEDWTLEKIMAPDYALPQTNITELGDFPTSGRTDVYFLGVPRGGKSSVLAGIFYEMYRRGQVTYEPQFNSNGVDKCNSYFKGLIKAVDSAKFPVSTASDSISFMKLILTNGRRENPLTFVEIAGEDFRSIAGGNDSGKEVWERIGAAQCLQSKNRKLLAFILDYSITKGNVRPDSSIWTDMEQALVLDDALNVLGHDGHGKKNEEECTLSKVDSVAVIVTKSDLIGNNLSKEQRISIANEYIKSKFSNFMNNLSRACKKHGINAPVGYQPYVLTFSLGKLLIGNTYDYDPSDSANIIDFISSVTTGKTDSRWKSIFG